MDITDFSAEGNFFFMPSVQLLQILSVSWAKSDQPLGLNKIKKKLKIAQEGA